MTASVASFLTQAQKKGAELPPALSGTLLLAAARLSDAQSQAVRPYQLLVDDEGALELLAGDVPSTDGYAAPELRNGAVLPDDSRVLVFAAGALGYELITLVAPKPGDEGGGPEVKGPLAPVIRKAMAERQHRFRTLRDMVRAIEAIQGRPARDQERLILAAVAASTPLPPAQKLAKLELQKAASPEVAPPPQPERKAQADPVFTQVWDPLEGQAKAAAADPPPPEPKPAGPPPAVPEADRKELERLAIALQTGKRDLADLGTRISMVEEQIRTSLPPSLEGAAALSRDAKLLLERRSFAEAERVLQDPRVANDAALQLLFGQALSGGGGTDPARLDRAVAAFRRAVELDASWAQPRAMLGTVLFRQGKQAEARACFREALRLDPACTEALAALPRSRVGAAAFALSGAGGAVVAAAVLLAFRPAAAPATPAKEPQVTAAAVAAPVPPPQPSKPPESVAASPEAPKPVSTPPPPPAPRPEPIALRLPERTPEAEVKPPRPEPRARKKPAARAAAEAEAAKGEKALRAFDTKAAEAAFASALKLDPTLPSAHRGMGMVYVLLGNDSAAKAEYARYLKLAPDAPDKDRIARVLSR